MVDGSAVGLPVEVSSGVLASEGALAGSPSPICS